MTDNSGAMTPDVQIKCSVEEAMENAFRAIFGENRHPTITYTMSKVVESGLGTAYAMASALIETDRKLQLKADVPIRHPDAENGGYRVDDNLFVVEANDWGEGSRYEVWCEHNPYNGAKVIVRQVYPDGRERWMVADSMEGEVLYRGSHASLFPWAKQVVAEKWPDLLHVQIDTETAAMKQFVSHKAPSNMSSYDD